MFRATSRLSANEMHSSASRRNLRDRNLCRSGNASIGNTTWVTDDDSAEGSEGVKVGFALRNGRDRLLKLAGGVGEWSVDSQTQSGVELLSLLRKRITETY
jgi:hypothetical protein